MGKSPKITARMRKFAAGKALHGNGTQAAKEAGYSLKSARTKAWELMKDPRIKDLVRQEKARLEEERKKKQLDAAEQRTYNEGRIRAEIAAIAFSRITDVCTFDGDNVELLPSAALPDHAVAAIAEVTQTHTQFGTNVRIKLHPKMPALQLAAQEIGMLVERHEVTEKKAKAYVQLVAKMVAEEIDDPEILERIAAKLEELEDG